MLGKWQSLKYSYYIGYDADYYILIFEQLCYLEDIVTEHVR